MTVSAIINVSSMRHAELVYAELLWKEGWYYFPGSMKIIGLFLGESGIIPDR